MNIKQENLIELVNVGFDEMNIQFEKLSDKILPYVMKLSNRTGIGSSSKFTAGITWKNLRESALRLISDGKIKVT